MNLWTYYWLGIRKIASFLCPYQITESDFKKKIKLNIQPKCLCWIFSFKCWQGMAVVISKLHTCTRTHACMHAHRKFLLRKNGYPDMVYLPVTVSYNKAEKKEIKAEASSSRCLTSKELREDSKIKGTLRAMTSQAQRRLAEEKVRNVTLCNTLYKFITFHR